MAKIINRALSIAGEKIKVGGGVVVTVVTADYQNHVTRCYGATVPTGSTAGYAPGCYFYKSTGGSPGAMVYINEGSAASCTFNAVTSGAAGATTWDALYAFDQTLAITGTTLTFDGQHATNDVFTLTQTGAGSGSLLQITNVGSGKDISGTSASWSFDKTGVAVMKSVTFAGSAGATALAMTLGNIVLSAGGISITKAADNATLSVTNNTSATATMVAIAGSGTFTGSTTTSFMTITPSGLTSGTAVYMPLAALTTGKGLHIVANAYSDGLVFDITSSSTASSSTGRLFNLAHSATLNVSTVIAEMSTAAQDETILLKLTASDALALGKLLQVSAASMTTGTAIDIPDMAVLTSGIGVSIVSSATAITGAGRLFFSNHTGATGTSAILNEFKTAATDETVLLKLTTAAMINGVALQIAGTTGMTTGSLISASSSTAAAVATNGIISLTATGAFTSNAQTDGGFVEIKANSTLAGTIFNLTGTSLTTGTAMVISNGTSAMTTGSLLAVLASGTGTIATNGLVSIRHAGIYTSTSNAGLLDVQASAVVGTGTLVNFKTTAAAQLTTTVLNVENSGFTTGYTGSMLRVATPSTTGGCKVIDVIANGMTTSGTVLSISATALTTGVGINIVSSGGTAAMTSGSLIRVAVDGTGAIITNGLISYTHTGAFTSNSAIDGGFVEIKANSTTAGTIWNLVGSALTTGVAANISSGTSNITTGSLLRVANGGTGAIATNGIVSFTHTGAFTSNAVTDGGFVEVKANSTTAGTIVNIVGSGITTGVALSISNGTAATTTGSLIRAVAGGTGAVATNGIYSFTHTGVYTSTSSTLGMFRVAGTATTAGTVFSASGASLVGGKLMVLRAVDTALTTGRYLSLDDTTTGEVFGIGANGHLHSTASIAVPTIAVTQQNGITAAAITAGGTDTCGAITTTGTNNNGGTTILQVTFGKTYTTAPKYVGLMPLNASAALNGGSSNGCYISAITATTFSITIPANASAGATPSWAYYVIA